MVRALLILVIHFLIQKIYTTFNLFWLFSSNYKNSSGVASITLKGVQFISKNDCLLTDQFRMKIPKKTTIINFTGNNAYLLAEIHFNGQTFSVLEQITIQNQTFSYLMGGVELHYRWIVQWGYSLFYFILILVYINCDSQ